MTRRSLKSNHLVSFAACFGAFLLYVKGLPSTVQTGDTGELVANSYLYQVSHPSGYPLLVNLQYAFTHLFAFGTVFYRAAFLNAAFAAGTLLLLCLASRNRWFGIGVALCLAFSKTFWRYGELPDVFALNALIAAGILFLFCRDDLKPGLRIWSSSLLFFAGLCNHLSILFLAPLVFSVLLRAPVSPQDRRQIQKSLLAGAVLFVSVYSSLMAMHPDRFYSWGRLTTPRAVISHFLREDYGRTRKGQGSGLVSEAAAAETPEKGHPPVGTQFNRELGTAMGHLFSAPASREFRFYLKSFALRTGHDFAPLLIFLALFLAYSVFQRRLDSRGMALLGVFILCCYVFFALVKIEPRADSLEVVERFFILPQLLLCFLLIQWLPRELSNRRAMIGFSIVLFLQAGVSLAQYRSVNDFSKNTIVEDYALNFLKELPENKASIILADGDTQFFALQYGQQIFGLRPQAMVISAPLLFHSWYSRKIFDRGEGFVFDADRIQDSLHFELEKDLLNPNVTQIPFYVSGGFSDSEHYHLTYLALGRRIDPGKGEEFDHRDFRNMRMRSTSEGLRSDAAEYDPYREIFAQYAFYDLALGKKLFTEKDFPAAQRAFLEALQKVPYCLPALENLCALRHSVGADTADCQSRIREFKSLTFDYFGN